MKQLTLFVDDAPPQADALSLLRHGADLVLSVSGGKDSDAMCHHLLDLRQAEGWTGQAVMVHADLGRAEWHNTPDDATASNKGRFVWNWLPLHDWTETHVWQAIRQHGNVFHPAYSLGNQRLSCALCVLGSVNDLLNGAIHNPDTYRELCRIEVVTGYSFRPNLWLSDLKPHLPSTETLSAIRHHKDRKLL
jgi:hypothetical protein